MFKKTSLMLAVAGSAFASQALAAPEFYGALKAAVEYRMMDKDEVVGNHTEIQDAYSYLGVKGEEELKNGLTAFYNYKVYVNAADGSFAKSDQTKWGGDGADSEHNVAKVGVKGGFGSVSVGRMWNAYYNHISYTTDRFSSGWTGFNTYASFQTDRTITYQNSFGPVSLGVNLVQGGAEDAVSGGSDTNRLIVGGTYTAGPVSVAIGFDGADDSTSTDDLLGYSVAYSQDALRVALTHETYGTDAMELTSLLAQYQIGKVGLNALYSDGDSFYAPTAQTEIGLGATYGLTDSVTVFAEYHTSDEFCGYDVSKQGFSTSDQPQAGAGTDGTIGACSVVSTGMHYTF